MLMKHLDLSCLQLQSQTKRCLFLRPWLVRIWSSHRLPPRIRFICLYRSYASGEDTIVLYVKDIMKDHMNRHMGITAEWTWNFLALSRALPFQEQPQAQPCRPSSDLPGHYNAWMHSLTCRKNIHTDKIK